MCEHVDIGGYPTIAPDTLSRCTLNSADSKTEVHKLSDRNQKRN